MRVASCSLVRVAHINRIELTKSPKLLTLEISIANVRSWEGLTVWKKSDVRARRSALRSLRAASSAVECYVIVVFAHNGYGYYFRQSPGLLVGKRPGCA